MKKLNLIITSGVFASCLVIISSVHAVKKNHDLESATKTQAIIPYQLPGCTPTPTPPAE